MCRHLLQLYLLKGFQSQRLALINLLLFSTVLIALLSMKSVKSCGTALPQKINSFLYVHTCVKSGIFDHLGSYKARA